jgi:hypothetical protein
LNVEFLSEAQLAAVDDRKYVTVEIPEWNAKVEIGSMSAQAATEYSVYAKRGDQVGAMRSLLAASLVNRERKPFEKKTIDALLQKSVVGITTIAEAILKLNTLDKKAAEERGEE